MRYLLGRELLVLPETLAVGDAISYVRKAMDTEEGMTKKYTFSGSVYFNRMKELNRLFQAEDVEIDRIIVGILSGRGQDLMDIQGRKAESVYFIPSLRTWFVETSMYPFLGGDSVEQETEEDGNLIPSINLILPYVMPGFIRGASKEAVYDLSMVCLQNARDILQVLEEEYQRAFERSLTLGRLNEVVISPRRPDVGSCIRYDQHLAASVYVSNDIERLVRLENLVK